MCYFATMKSERFRRITIMTDWILTFADWIAITIWLFNIAMERSTIFKFGKPSISMGHGFHGETLNNQGVIFLLAQPRLAGIGW